MYQHIIIWGGGGFMFVEFMGYHYPQMYDKRMNNHTLQHNKCYPLNEVPMKQQHFDNLLSLARTNENYSTVTKFINNSGTEYSSLSECAFTANE